MLSLTYRSMASSEGLSLPIFFIIIVGTNVQLHVEFEFTDVDNDVLLGA